MKPAPRGGGRAASITLLVLLAVNVAIWIASRPLVSGPAGGGAAPAPAAMDLAKPWWDATPAPAPADPASRGKTPPLAIVGVIVVHPRARGAAEVEPDATVVAVDGRVLEVGPSAAVQVPPDARVIDGRGRWLVPAFVDCHVHFGQSATPFTRPDMIDARARVPYEQDAERFCERLDVTLKLWLACGVTTVADMGGSMWGLRVRERAREIEASPRVLTAGPKLSYGMRIRRRGKQGAALTDPRDVEMLAPFLLAARPDYVKFYLLRHGPDASRELDMLAAVARVAGNASIPVAVHATDLEKARQALSLGARLLVHSVQDAPLDGAFLDLARERHAVYIPTLYVQDGYRQLMGGCWQATETERRLGDPLVLDALRSVSGVPLKGMAMRDESRQQGANLVTAWNSGLLVALGTDAGNPGTVHGPSIFREMALMQSAGLTPAQVLAAATVQGARALGLDDRIGSIRPGLQADYVLLAADPLLDVASCSQIVGVVKEGRYHDEAELLRGIQGP